MNSVILSSATGFARRVFRVADVDRMVEAGVIGHDERLELIDGEIIEIAPKGIQHEWLKTDLNRHFGRTCPDGVNYTPEAGWRIDEFNYLEPDFLFYPISLRLDAVAPPKALLVIEIAASSLAYDRGVKAALYAHMGVQEYWVVNALNRETLVHRLPSPGGYGSVEAHLAEAMLQPEFIPEIAVRLGDLAD